MIKTIRSPLGVSGEHCLGVGMGAKGPIGFQVFSQLGVIVDLSIVGDDRAVGADHGLPSSRRWIDNCEAAMRKTDAAAFILPETETVGPAMLDQRAHGCEHLI